MRIGPRCDTACANVCSITGHVLPWVTELRYLGAFIVRSRNFKCSLDTESDPFIGQRMQFLVKSAESPLKM